MKIYTWVNKNIPNLFMIGNVILLFIIIFKNCLQNGTAIYNAHVKV